MQAYKDISTWLEKNIVVEPGELFTVDYINVEAPNMFVLINPDDTVLKISISKIPTPYKYEFTIKGCTHDVFGRPTRTRQIYILNDGGIPAHIKLFSTYDKFDISVLKSHLVNMDKFDFEFDGICKGFQSDVMLPSGTNCLGSIEPGQKFVEKLNEILEKNNSIISGMTTAISRLTDLLALNDTGQDILEAINEKGNNVIIGGISMDENIQVDANINVDGFFHSEEKITGFDFDVLNFSDFNENDNNHFSAVEIPVPFSDFKKENNCLVYRLKPTGFYENIEYEIELKNGVFSQSFWLNVTYPKRKENTNDSTSDKMTTVSMPDTYLTEKNGKTYFYKYSGYDYASALGDAENYSIFTYTPKVCLSKYDIKAIESGGVLSEAFLIKKFTDFSGKYDINFSKNDKITIGNGSYIICNYLKIIHLLDDGDTYLKGVINVSFKLLSGDEKTFYFSKDIKELELKANITKITFSLPDGSMVTQMLINIIGGFI